MPDSLSPETREAVRAFLESQSTMALATVTPDGEPQTAPLFYVSDAHFNLYWLSAATSRHSVNLAANERAAATIYPAVWYWHDIHGLQIEGAARPVTDKPTRDNILALYRAKFDLPAALDLQIMVSTLYVLKPKWLRWLDNRVAFGHKTEVELAGND